MADPTQARSAAGANLGDAAKELALHQVGVNMAAGAAVAIDHLPVPDRVLEFRRELLSAGSGNENHPEERRGKGA